jgi:hypothetical protein
VIVYVETNFLLELAYLQERYEACQALLGLAAAGSIRLVIPSFSVAEARATWARRAGERKGFQDEVQRQIQQLSRSRPFRTLRQSSAELLAALADSGEESRERLEDTLDTIVGHGILVPLTEEILRDARACEKTFALSPPDAIVFSSVLAHLSSAPTAPKCFATQDAKDFASPSVDDELGKHSCKVLVNFEDTLGHVQAHLRARLAGDQPPGFP